MCGDTLPLRFLPSEKGMSLWVLSLDRVQEHRFSPFSGHTGTVM